MGDSEEIPNVYEQLERQLAELATLRAENARLREVLVFIAYYARQCGKYTPDDGRFETIEGKCRRALEEG